MMIRFRRFLALLLLLFSAIFLLVACVDQIPTDPPNPPDTNIKTDTTAPQLTFDETELFRARASSISGTITDESSISTIKLFESDQLIASNDSSDTSVSNISIDDSGKWQTSFKAKNLGEHKFRLTVVDAVGNSATIDQSLMAQESYNIVVLLTDDQYFDTLQYMPFVQSTLLPQSLNFTEALITIPVCCPARASLLSGFHGHNTGVLTNPSPNGTRHNFNEQDTIPLHLQQRGYDTGFIGKYLHGYSPGFVPPGWTSFVANNEGGQMADWINLRDITIGSSTEQAGRGRIIRSLRQHLLSYHREKSVEFIDSYTKTEDPFFLYISTYAPHPPSTPEAVDANKYLDFNFSGRSFNEQDLSDKPRWVQESRTKNGQCDDVIRRKHLQSLQGVDRMMEDVWQSVEASGQMDRTIFILTSDNGLTFGEHGLPCDKGMAYEEAIRVPFVVRMPDGQVGTSDLLTSVNLDLATTIYDLVGFEKETDGLSLLPILQKQTPDTWREYLPIEAYGYLNWRFDTQGIWSGIRTKEWKYVETADDLNELYNLKDDPFEMQNLFSTGQHTDVITSMQGLVNKHRGLAITTFDLPDAERGQPYQTTLTAWGGSQPYTWFLKGRLPNGLSLNSQTGIISGTATSRGRHSFRIQVTSPKLATHRQQNQQFFFDYELVVK